MRFPVTSTPPGRWPSPTAAAPPEGDENTAEAFARAVGLGYRYIETDVHATADGVPVVFHDPTLERLTGRPGRIADLRWADLASVRVGGAAAVPRLDEVLDAWPQVRFNIDVKADSGVGPRWRRCGGPARSDRVLLASFSDARLARLRRLAGPRVATSTGRCARRPASGWPPASAGRCVLPASVVAVQVPLRFRRVRVVDAPVPAARAPARAAGARLDDRRSCRNARLT